MNPFYSCFTKQGKALALEHELSWETPCDSVGNIEKSYRWDLAKVSGLATPPYYWLSNLGLDSNALDTLNQYRKKKALAPIKQSCMSIDWQNLYKSAVLNEALVKRNKPAYALQNIGRSLRILATCSESTPPWDLKPETIQLAYNIALKIGESGKASSNLITVIKTVIDGNHLADHFPLAIFCRPYNDESLLKAEEAAIRLRKSNNSYRSTRKVKSELAARNDISKLPNRDAFITLVNIVFNCPPKSFSDAIRFQQIKSSIITGFRIGETVLLPADWARWHDHPDRHGEPAGDQGGISRSLSIRHFAEKQAHDHENNKFFLYENSQHVPPIFEDALVDVLQIAEKLTQPLRSRLQKQVSSGRLFPEFDHKDLVSIVDMYTRLSGSIQTANFQIPSELIKKYRSSYDPCFLEEIYESQMNSMREYGPHRQVLEYWRRLNGNFGLKIRDAFGKQKHFIDWFSSFVRVGEVEECVRKNIPSKLPDTEMFNLQGGKTLSPADLLFLMPIRGLSDERDGNILDVRKYFSVGRALPYDLQLHLGGNKKNNIFVRYGANDEERRLSLNTHSIRHLQNTALFQGGVPDSIITKRFNRRSISQSHVYDHRSLAEELSEIELPAGSEFMPPRALDILRMAQERKVGGPIIDEFRMVQKKLGDDAAFQYLSTEADGLHVTPYGFCVNSFNVDPCPKNLECYNGCRHLTRTSIKSEEVALTKLKERMISVINLIERTPNQKHMIGWKNQLAHAKTRLSNIEKALTCSPGDTPFPDGPSLFKTANTEEQGTIVDELTWRTK